MQAVDAVGAALGHPRFGIFRVLADRHVELEIDTDAGPAKRPQLHRAGVEPGLAGRGVGRRVLVDEQRGADADYDRRLDRPCGGDEG